MPLQDQEPLFQSLPLELKEEVCKQLLISSYRKGYNLDFSSFRKLRILSKDSDAFVNNFFKKQCELEFSYIFQRPAITYKNVTNWLRNYEGLVRENYQGLFLKAREALHFINQNDWAALQQTGINYSDLWYQSNSLHRINFFKIACFGESLKNTKFLIWFKKIVVENFSTHSDELKNNFTAIRHCHWELLFNAEHISTVALQKTISLMVQEELQHPTEQNCYSILHLAAEFGRLDWIKFALEAGAITLLDRRDGSDLTALHLAAAAGHKEVAEALQEAGADPGDNYAIGFKNFPITLAVKLLSDDATTLLNAVENGRVSAVNNLLAMQVNPNAKNKTIETGKILATAVRKGNVEIVNILLRAGAEPDITNAMGDTVLHTAVKAKNTIIVKALLAANANPNTKNVQNDATALYLAVSKNYIPIIEALLKAKANPDIKSEKDGGIAPLFAAIEQESFKAIELLVNAGANLVTRNSVGDTPLHYIATKNNIEIVKYLIAMGADPLATNDKGLTPIEYAKEFGQNVAAEIMENSIANPPLTFFALKTWWDRESKVIEKDHSSIDTAFAEILTVITNPQHTINEKAECISKLVATITNWSVIKNTNHTPSFFKPNETNDYPIVDTLLEKLNQLAISIDNSAKPISNQPLL